MAIKRPDIYEHNNPNNAFVDSDFTRGGFRTAVANLSALYALSGKTDQLKAHSTVVYVTDINKYYILKDIGSVGNLNGWEEFVTGSGSIGGMVTGATNGLMVSDKNVKLGGNLCERTTIYTCGNGLYFAASPVLNSYVQTCLSNTFGQNTYQVLFNDTGSTKSNHFCMSSTSGELYFSCDSNNCSSLYGDIGKLCLTNKIAGASKIVVLDGNALNYGNNYASSFVARSLPDVAWVTACTTNYLGNYYTKSQINYYTGTTVPNVYVTKSQINFFTGTTLPANYLTKTAINYYTGTTVPNNYYNKTQINQYTGNTNNRINTIETRYISGATNGLTKTDNVVCLGGQLIDNMCIYTTNVANNCSYFNFDRTNNSISTYTKGGNISLCSIPNGDLGGKICITTTSGMTYAADYSANYVNRSIVDKEYVDKKMSIINVHNNNGVCPFYISATDNFVGVSGYTVGNCACLYLVATPAIGQKIIVADIQGGALDYPITIDGNGKFINGNSAVTINTGYGSLTFIYNGYFWSAVAFVN